MTSPVMLIGMICGALDEEHKRNPGADLMRAKEIVLQCCERAAWEATRMDSPDMYPCTEQPYEVRHG